MVQRKGGFRRKTRHKLKKNKWEKGQLSLRKYMQTFEMGSRVLLHAEPSVQRGMYFPRYHGKSGIIKGKQGKCYKVLIKDFGKEKVILTHPVHLRKQ